MQIRITGKHIEVTEAIKKYIEEKVGKLEKNLHPVIDASVIISVEKYRHIVEAILKTNVSIVKVTSQSEDMYAAIDLAMDKLSKQLKKVKEKLKDHKSREPKIDEIMAMSNLEDEDREPSYLLKQVEVKHMDIEEARMQLDVLEYAFLVFRNTATDILNVIYKSKCGDYIVLEPGNA